MTQTLRNVRHSGPGGLHAMSSPSYVKHNAAAGGSRLENIASWSSLRTCFANEGELITMQTFLPSWSEDWTINLRQFGKITMKIRFNKMKVSYQGKPGGPGGQGGTPLVDFLINHAYQEIANTAAKRVGISLQLTVVCSLSTSHHHNHISKTKLASLLISLIIMSDNKCMKLVREQKLKECINWLH